MSELKGACIIGQSGGPTSVINSSVLGAIEAAKSANKKIFIVGFDGTADGVKAVENGTMSATIAQQPEVMGKQGLEVAVKAAKGEKVDAKVSAPLKLIEKK